MQDINPADTIILKQYINTKQMQYATRIRRLTNRTFIRTNETNQTIRKLIRRK